MASNQISEIVNHSIQTFGGGGEYFAVCMGELMNILNKTSVSDVNLDHCFFNPKFWHDQGRAPVIFIPIYEDYIVSIGIFVVKPRMTIPIHDHPQMYGLVKVLAGSVRVSSYTLCGKVMEYEYFKPFYPPVITVEKHPEVIADETSDTLCLTPLEHNIHEIVSLDGPAVFIDIVAPPYSQDFAQNGSRNITYFKEVDSINATIRKFKSIPKPDWYWTEVFPYAGPEILIHPMETNGPDIGDVPYYNTGEIYPNFPNSQYGGKYNYNPNEPGNDNIGNNLNANLKTLKPLDTTTGNYQDTLSPMNVTSSQDGLNKHEKTKSATLFNTKALFDTAKRVFERKDGKDVFNDQPPCDFETCAVNNGSEPMQESKPICDPFHQNKSNVDQNVDLRRSFGSMNNGFGTNFDQKNPNFGPNFDPNHPNFGPNFDPKNPNFEPNFNPNNPDFGPNFDPKNPNFGPNFDPNNPDFHPNNNLRPNFDTDNFGPDSDNLGPNFDPNLRSNFDPNLISNIDKNLCDETVRLKRSNEVPFDKIGDPNQLRNPKQFDNQNQPGNKGSKNSLQNTNEFEDEYQFANNNQCENDDHLENNNKFENDDHLEKNKFEKNQFENNQFENNEFENSNQFENYNQFGNNNQLENNSQLENNIPLENDNQFENPNEFETHNSMENQVQNQLASQKRYGRQNQPRTQIESRNQNQSSNKNPSRIVVPPRKRNPPRNQNPLRNQNPPRSQTSYKSRFSCQKPLNCPVQPDNMFDNQNEGLPEHKYETPCRPVEQTEPCRVQFSEEVRYDNKKYISDSKYDLKDSFSSESIKYDSDA